MLPIVSPLIKTEAASRIRTPLTEIAVGAAMLLILAFFRTADEAIRRYLETYSIFIDKLLLTVSHSLFPSSGHKEDGFANGAPRAKPMVPL